VRIIKSAKKKKKMKKIAHVVEVHNGKQGETLKSITPLFILHLSLAICISELWEVNNSR
jgi:hypothetical protein